MVISNDISQISAEMLLNYLFPKLREKWTARYAGTFYRNYNNDHLSIYEDMAEVVLARDGFLKLLPEALLSDENELRGDDFAEKYHKLERRKKLFSEAFLPFDTFAFKQKLHIEQQTAELLQEKLTYLLKICFNYDITAETNPYIKEMAVLLPYVSRLRADFNSIAKLLGTVIGCETKMVTSRYSHVDNTRYWIPQVEFQLLIPDLTEEEYRKLMEDITPLEHFIAEWFIPAEVRCKISIKHHQQPQITGNNLLLNYNTEF